MGELVQRNWLQELEDAEMVNSVEMQHFVRKMRGQDEFSPLEVAGILGWGADAGPVYALCESGELGFLARPTAKDKRRSYRIPRASLLAFLKKHCNKV